MQFKKKTAEIDVPEIIDIGHVGEITQIDTALIDMLVNGDFSIL